MIELHVGRGITRGAMTVFPLWSATSGYRRYTMGGRGLHVTESPEGPQVGTLMVGNVEDRPALVLEGQLFEGGWQHRMARHSLMVGVHQQVPVEVACVEQGRWGGSSSQHSRGRRATPYVADSVRRGRDVQGEVWRRVAEHTRGFEGLGTGSFVDRLDLADAERTQWADLRPLPGQSGVLIGIGGQPYVAEVFDSSSRLRAQLPALLEAAALDARFAPAVATPGRRARRFIERLDRVRPRRTEPAGIAERTRGASEHLDVVALTWQGHHVHTRVTHVQHPLLVGAGR